MSSQSQRSAPQTTRVASTEGGSPFVGSVDGNSDVQSTLTPPQANTCSSTPVLDKVGNTTVGETERDVYLRAAQDVVTQSNEKGAADPTWHAFNGGNQGVYKDDPNANKPDAWKRGIELEQAEGRDANGLQNYTIKGKHDGETGGIDDIEEFRDLIKADLNFNDAFSKFPDEAAWIDALLKKHCPDAGPDSPDRKRVEAIGVNLWSYAMTGADTEGNTDIAELQGMLYGLDSLLAEASQSNTPHGGKFTIPGTDIELDDKGDGIYGRGSELEARLLAAVVQVPQEEIPKKDPDPEAFDESYLLVDASGTMYDNYAKLGRLMDEVDFGTTTLGAFADYGADLGDGDSFRLSPDGAQDSDDVRKKLDALSQAAQDAPTEVGGTRKAVAGVDPAFDLDAGARESSIHSALQLLQDDAKFPPPPHVIPTRRQIVVATDEKDCRPDELGTLRDLAREKDVDVKVVYMMDTGMFVISVNAIDDDTIALVGQVGAAQRDGILTRGVPVEEQSHHPDQDYLRLDWKEIARRQGVQKTPYE